MDYVHFLTGLGKFMCACAGGECVSGWSAKTSYLVMSSLTVTVKVTYIHTHVHIYIHTYIHTHTHIHTYIHTYIHTHFLIDGSADKLLLSGARFQVCLPAWQSCGTWTKYRIPRK